MWLLEEKEFREQNKFKVVKYEERCDEDFTIASTNTNITMGVLN